MSAFERTRDVTRIPALWQQEEDEENSASHVQTIEVVKLMRSMCAGQHKRLQDLLRVQHHNRESVDLYDEVVKYIAALEPVGALACARVPGNSACVRKSFSQGDLCVVTLRRG